MLHEPVAPAARARFSVAGVRAAAVVVAVAFGLTACVPSATEPTTDPTPSESATALFASEEEALAAAEEAYRAYLDVSNLVGQEGGANPERFEAVAVGRLLELELANASEVASAGARTQGAVELRSIEVQSLNAGSVVVYACLDYASLALVRADGSVQPLGASGELTPVEVTLRVSAGRLFVERQETWDADSFC